MCHVLQEQFTGICKQGYLLTSSVQQSIARHPSMILKLCLQNGFCLTSTYHSKQFFLYLYSNLALCNVALLLNQRASLPSHFPS